MVAYEEYDFHHLESVEVCVYQGSELVGSDLGLYQNADNLNYWVSVSKD